MLQDPKRKIPAMEFILRGFMTSVVFFTRIPMPRFVQLPLMRAAWSFTLVGMFPAIVVSMGAWLFARYLPGLDALIAAVFLMLVDVFIRGALHEDGLADTFDALGLMGKQASDSKDIEHVFDDPHTGVFGIMALILVSLMRLAIYYYAVSSGDVAGIAVIILAASWSRLMPLVLSLSIPLASSMGLAGSAGKPHLLQFIIAYIPPLAVTVYFFSYLEAFTYWIVIELITITVYAWLRGRFKAINGDIMGAGILLSEVLIAFALIVTQVLRG